MNLLPHWLQLLLREGTIQLQLPHVYNQTRTIWWVQVMYGFISQTQTSLTVQSTTDQLLVVEHFMANFNFMTEEMRTVTSTAELYLASKPLCYQCLRASLSKRLLEYRP